MSSTSTAVPLIPQWTVADRIRKARRTAGLSQQDLAEALGVQVSRLSNWEAGANRPRDLEAVARGVSEATGVPAMWILGFEPDPAVQNWK